MSTFFKCMLATGLSLAASLSFASVIVTEPDDGFNIATLVSNQGSVDVLRITFDFSTTLTSDGSPLVIDGSPTSSVAHSGSMTATFFRNTAGTVFGFDFVDFNPGEMFEFKWDPDSLLNADFGSTGLAFVGGHVSALTTEGTLSGQFGVVGNTNEVSAVLTAPTNDVPEPAALALLATSLAGGLATTRRRTTR